MNRGMSEQAADARIESISLLNASHGQSAEQEPVTIAKAQVWATLAISYELASAAA